MIRMKFVILILNFASISLADFSEERGFSLITTNCSDFLDLINVARNLVSHRRTSDRDLQLNGFVLQESDLGYSKASKSPPKKITLFDKQFSDKRSTEVINTAAALAADRSGSDLTSFERNAQCLRKSESEISSRSKYRAISNYGNNFKHPTWGNPNTPFGRFAPKNYDDDVRSIRLSVTGSDLPSPRKLVQNVLLKVPKTKRPADVQCTLLNLFVLYITHDLAHQIPVSGYNKDDKIRCCSSGNRKLLSPHFSHSECLPISIGKVDPFYSHAKVRCLNMVRSETATSAGTLRSGEVMNAATAYMDHSIIYGVDEDQSKKSRTLRDGKLNLGPKNTLPTDPQGKYTKSTDRLTSIPIGAVIPVIFSRHHNNVASGLKAINPSWNDERLFQEARRINIAVFQKIVYKGRVIEAVANQKVQENYNENVDPSTSVEFSTAAYRFLHYFSQPNLPLVSKDNQVQNITLSDTLGRMDIVENHFDDVVRGLINQQLNYGEYTDEIFHKFAKNQHGVGIDLLSIDIQRGRDHGLPTFLEARRKCGFDDIKTFEGLLSIFPQSYVDILKSNYDSVEDVDLYVGGALESFTTHDQILIGKTFACMVAEQYKRTMAADSYFYSHANNPNPFNEAQLTAITNTAVSNLICTTTNLESVRQFWFITTEGPKNPSIPCSFFKPMDLTAWKNI